MCETFEPEITTSSLPVADITIQQYHDVETVDYQYPIKRPKEYEGDFMMPVRASDLNKARTILSNSKIVKFPIHEVLLGIPSVGLGATIGAFTSGTKLNTLLGSIMYLICPLITVGTFVAYVFIRRENMKNIADTANHAMEYIPNPEGLTEEKYEH